MSLNHQEDFVVREDNHESKVIEPDDKPISGDTQNFVNVAPISSTPAYQQIDLNSYQNTIKAYDQHNNYEGGTFSQIYSDEAEDHDTKFNRPQLSDIIETSNEVSSKASSCTSSASSRANIGSSVTLDQKVDAISLRVITRTENENEENIYDCKIVDPFNEELKKDLLSRDDIKNVLYSDPTLVYVEGAAAPKPVVSGRLKLG